MRHTFSKRNAFGTAIALGLGFTVAKIIAVFAYAGVMMGVQRLFV